MECVTRMAENFPRIGSDAEIVFPVFAEVFMARMREHGDFRRIETAGGIQDYGFGADYKFHIFRYHHRRSEEPASGAREIAVGLAAFDKSAFRVTHANEQDVG